MPFVIHALLSIGVPSCPRFPNLQRPRPRPAPRDLIACHDCDALFETRESASGEASSARIAPAKLHAHRPNGVHRAAALAVSAASFFLVANIFPFIELKAGGQVSRIVLAQSVSALETHGSPGLAAAVAVFILAAPTVMIGGMLYLLLPLLRGRRLPGALPSLPLGLWHRYLEYDRGLPARRARQPDEARGHRHDPPRHFVLGFCGLDRLPRRFRFLDRSARALGPSSRRAQA